MNKHEELIRRARELAALAKKAIPGPWEYSSFVLRQVSSGASIATFDRPPDDDDEALIVAAPEMACLLSKLADELENLSQQIQDLEAEIDALEIINRMKGVPPPRTWVPTGWLDNLEEVVQISRDAWPYVWQLIDIYRIHDHPEIEARPIIDVLDEMFIKFQRAYFKVSMSKFENPVREGK